MRKVGTNHEALFLCLHAASPLAVSRIDAAHMLGVGLRTLDRALATSELKARKMGGRVVVPIVEIERFLDHLDV